MSSIFIEVLKLLIALGYNSEDRMLVIYLWSWDGWHRARSSSNVSVDETLFLGLSRAFLVFIDRSHLLAQNARLLRRILCRSIFIFCLSQKVTKSGKPYRHCHLFNCEGNRVADLWQCVNAATWKVKIISFKEQLFLDVFGIKQLFCTTMEIQTHVKSCIRHVLYL